MHRRSESRARQGPSVLGFLAAAVLAGCLGADYKSIELSVSEWDHGWQVTVEPDEDFGVGVQALRAYPDARWSVATADPAVLEQVEQFVAQPEPGSPSSARRSVFRFRAAGAGETGLVLEAREDDAVVGRVEYTVAVVPDACAMDSGVTAPRCRNPKPAHDRGWTEWDHGRGVRIALEDADGAVTLTAPPLHPQARWRVAEVDESVLSVAAPQVGQVRQPGDFDNSDTSKPDSFLPVWRFGVDGLELGESTLAFEAVDAGQRVDLAEFSVEVVESVEEGDYLAPDS